MADGRLAREGAAVTPAVVAGAIAIGLVAGLVILLVRRRRRLANRYVAIDTRRAEQIGRLVAAQRGPAETAAEGFRDDLS